MLTSSAPNTVADVPGKGRPILLAWEMGEGFAHAGRLLWVARRLIRSGWRPVVAARDPATLRDAYEAEGIDLFPAPPHAPCFTGEPPFRAASYADVMGICGYADREKLAALVAGWEAILAQHQPAAIIADYSPLLSLAAFRRIPLIPIGDGFVVPPALPDGGFPPLGARQPDVWPPADLLANARAVQARRGQPLPDSLPQIVNGIGGVVSIPPELDIYADWRPQPAAGPWERPEAPLPPPDAPRFFGYLRMNHPQARQAVKALIDTGMQGELFLHDIQPGMAAALAGAGILLHETPPPIREALARASLFIHHGGIGSLTDAATTGRMQLLLPRHREQTCNAKLALETLPGCFMAAPRTSAETLRAELPKLIANRHAFHRAQACAARIAARPGTAWAALQPLLARV